MASPCGQNPVRYCLAREQGTGIEGPPPEFKGTGLRVNTVFAAQGTRRGLGGRTSHHGPCESVLGRGRSQGVGGAPKCAHRAIMAPHGLCVGRFAISGTRGMATKTNGEQPKRSPLCSQGARHSSSRVLK